MKKKITFLTIMMMSAKILLAWDGSVATGYAGGDGTESNPYQIATASQLALLAYEVNNEYNTHYGDFFVLTADLDLFGTSDGDTIQWIPIGTCEERYTDGSTLNHPFRGNFNGNNHTIMNLYIHRLGYNVLGGFTGLFGYVTDCRIENLNMENVDINSDYTEAAALCVYAGWNTQINNCHILSGSVRAHYLVAGIVGWIKSSRKLSTNNYVDYICGVTNCTNNATIGAKSKTCGLVGGIAGSVVCRNNFSFCYFRNCINYGSVIGSGDCGTGGICGRIESNTELSLDTVVIDYCKNYGDMIPAATSGTGEAGYFGGIVGNYQCGGSIEHCLNSGTMHHNYYNIYASGGAGGIAGNAFVKNCRIRYCVNTSDIYQTTYAGGICGNASLATIQYCLNAGEISGARFFGGITGIAKNSSGSVQECLSIRGISGVQECGEVVGEYGQMALNCFFDKQMCSYGYGSYRNSASDSWGRFTNEMTGTGLASSLTSEHWVYSNGMYPCPAGVENEDIAILATTPIFLRWNNASDYDKLQNVHCSLQLGGPNDIVWTAEDAMIINGHNVDIVDTVSSGSRYILYASFGDALRTITFGSTAHSSCDTIIDTASAPYNFNGQVITQSGIYQTHFTSANGCDSIVVLQIHMLIKPQIQFQNGTAWCQNTTNIKIPCTIIKGSAHLAYVTFTSQALQQGFTNGFYSITADNIVIPTPTTCDGGTIRCSVYAVDTTNGLHSDTSNVYFDILLDGYLHSKFGTVLFVDNNPNNGLPNTMNDKSFTAYQWYKNGNQLNGETGQYIYEKNGLNGTYQVLLTSTDNHSYRTRPASFTQQSTSSTGILQSTTVLPRSPLKLTEEFDGCYTIYLPNGIPIQSGNATLPIIAPSLRGIYILHIVDGLGHSFIEKFIVI